MNTNKTSEVLKHLQTYGSITSIEAINLFGATRLSAIIYRLRNEGYTIYSVREITKDRYGHVVPYVKYTFGKQNVITNNVKAETNSLFQDLFPNGKEGD